MSYFEDAHVSLTNYQQTPLISDIFSVDNNHLSIDTNPQPMNKGSGGLDIMNGGSDDLEYDYYDYLAKKDPPMLFPQDIGFYTETVAKFVDSVVFSNVISLGLWGSSVVLDKLSVPFLPKVLNGMSIGLGKNIVMSSCADDFKSYVASSRIYNVIDYVVPECLTRFINDEIALTALNVLLNGIQDLKTELLISVTSGEVVDDLQMKTPEYPDRIVKTGFQRGFKDISVALSDYYIDFIPAKAKYFVIDTAKGVCKDLIWSGGQLHIVIGKNIAVTAAKYLGEYAYLNFAKEHTDYLISQYVTENYHLNYLAGKLSSAILPTTFLTVLNKAI